MTFGAWCFRCRGTGEAIVADFNFLVGTAADVHGSRMEIDSAAQW